MIAYPAYVTYRTDRPIADISPILLILVTLYSIPLYALLYLYLRFPPSSLEREMVECYQPKWLAFRLKNDLNPATHGDRTGSCASCARHQDNLDKKQRN